MLPYRRSISMCTRVQSSINENDWRRIKMKRLHTLYTAIMAACMLPLTPVLAASGTGSIILIQTGDIHGHLMPRYNLRSDRIGSSKEGGVARMYSKIQEIRSLAVDDYGVNRSLLINTGDTVQGSGEALFSRGQAMIDVLNDFGYAAHVPGNWDFLYGTSRFEETFKGINGNPPLANWGAVAGNLYNTSQPDPAAICPGKNPATGATMNFKRVLPPYSIKQVGNLKVGILGMTTARAIAAVGASVTQNYVFTDSKDEVRCFVGKLRNEEKVDLVVMISEMEMARDIQIAETIAPAPDVILNSDMHERTTAPIDAVNPAVPGHHTLIVEEGQDGTVVGQMNLHVKKGVIDDWKFKQHIINDSVPEDPAVAAKVAQVRAPYVSGTFVPGQTVSVGGNTTELLRPVDEVIAYTEVDLHRSNFVDEDLPAVVEGSSHDLIADAMAVIGQAQASSIRGFRYGTHIPAGGEITMEDIYHYIPIVAKLGRTSRACGADLKFAIENSIGGTFHPDPTQWTGGWMFGYSGLNYDVDGCSGFMGATPVNPTQLTSAVIGTPNRFRPWNTARGTNIRVNGNLVDDFDVYDNRPASPTYQRCLAGDGHDTPHDGYTVTGYWYADAPTTINNCNPCIGRTIQVVMNDGSIKQVAGPTGVNESPNSLDVMDITEAVVRYLQVNLHGVVTAADLPLHRLTVKRLPTINPYSFPVIQPLKGASSATCPAS
jgi:sulfur-oxidizing protein SoxB